ncbi:MAG: sigma-70 family RNA polymerase sigma factor [Bryobacteraceae bacterium]
MDAETAARLKALLADAAEKGFVHYKALGEFFADASTGGPELDEVLSRLESGGIAIVADAKTAPDKEPGETVPERLDGAAIIDADPVKVYLREVAKVPRLTPEDETRLAERIQNNGTDADPAKTQLVEANLWLVVAIARQYAGAGIHMLDLLQQGNAGLMHAAATFIPRRGYRFSTYAAFWAHRRLHEMVSNP